MKRFWRITVFDGMDMLFERRIPVTHIGSERLNQLMQLLAAKHGLGDDEIVNDRLNRRTRLHSSFLKVTGSYLERSCGDNPYVYVVLIDEEGHVLKPPDTRA